jgi:hypothetical protein
VQELRSKLNEAQETRAKTAEQLIKITEDRAKLEHEVTQRNMRVDIQASEENVISKMRSGL